MFRKSPLSRISQIYQDDAGTHFLLHVRTDLSDVEIKWAARQQGILVNCLSEYCFADAQKYRGILVIHYSDMEDEVLQKVIGALEEIFYNLYNYSSARAGLIIFPQCGNTDKKECSVIAWKEKL